MCSQTVTPAAAAAAAAAAASDENIKCPFCLTRFVEEIGDTNTNTNTNTNIDDDDDHHLGSNSALSLWAPILLGILGGEAASPPIPNNPHLQFQQHHNNNDILEDDDDENQEKEEELLVGDRHRRRIRRSSAVVLHLLQGLRAGLLHSDNQRV